MNKESTTYAMPGPREGENTDTSTSSDDKLIADVVSDIIDYDVTSCQTTSSGTFEGSEYHPYNRPIGRARRDAHQSFEEPAPKTQDATSANSACDSNKDSKSLTEKP